MHVVWHYIFFMQLSYRKAQFCLLIYKNRITNIYENRSVQYGADGNVFDQLCKNTNKKNKNIF